MGTLDKTMWVLLTKTCCGYSLEVLRTSDEYPQQMFLSRYKKTINMFWLKKVSYLELYLFLRETEALNVSAHYYQSIGRAVAIILVLASNLCSLLLWVLAFRVYISLATEFI